MVTRHLFFLDKRAAQARSPEEEAGTRGGKDEKNGGGEEKETRRTQKVDSQPLERKTQHLSTFFFLVWKLDSSVCCRKRDERLKRVFEAKVKEEQREEEKKKKVEQKMAQIEVKNEVGVRSYSLGTFISWQG